MNLAKKIISYGYFSKEIPNEFTSEQLGILLDLIDISKSKLSKQLLSKWSKPIEFSIPKIENFRRIISVPNPLHYILLSNMLESNWSELEKHFNKSKVSLTTPIISNESNQSVKPKYDMQERIYRRISNLGNNKYILQTDITRYYPSIYTHSIAWALHTKEIAKVNINDPLYFGNEIDKLVRNMQDGQTIGIPIGPATSLVVQEIIGTAIDDEFSREMGIKVNGYRYTDDMEYYFTSLEAAERGLSQLNKIVKRYQLELNNLKTKIIKSPDRLEAEWVYYFRTFKFRKSDKRKINITMQKKDLISYFSKAFEFVKNNNEKGILTYALKTVRKTVIVKENWDVFESLVLNTALIDSLTIPTAFEIIEGYKYRDYPINIDKISKFINVLIQDNIDLKNDFEVTWALSIANRLRIKICEEVSQRLLQCDNAIINTLTMILNDNSLLSGNLNFDYYRSFFTKEDLYNSNWLFTYECCNQGWLNQSKNQVYIKNDNFYKQLLDNKISFIKPNFSIVAVELKNIVLEKINMESIIKSGKLVIETIRQNVLQVAEELCCNVDDQIVEEVILEITKKIDEIKEDSEEEIEENSEEEIKESSEKEIEEGSEEENSDREFKSDSWLKTFFTTDFNKFYTIYSNDLDIDY